MAADANGGQLDGQEEIVPGARAGGGLGFAGGAGGEGFPDPLLDAAELAGGGEKRAQELGEAVGEGAAVSSDAAQPPVEDEEPPVFVGEGEALVELLDNHRELPCEVVLAEGIVRGRGPDSRGEKGVEAGRQGGEPGGVEGDEINGSGPQPADGFVAVGLIRVDGDGRGVIAAEEFLRVVAGVLERDEGQVEGRGGLLGGGEGLVAADPERGLAGERGRDGAGLIDRSTQYAEVPGGGGSGCCAAQGHAAERGPARARAGSGRGAGACLRRNGETPRTGFSILSWLMGYRTAEAWD